jgi:folate-binding protein YgfZ
MAITIGIDATLHSASQTTIFMTTLSYQINTRQLTAFAPLAEELAYDSDKNYLFDLAYLAGIHVAGDRAQEFLQGQLSCNLLEVNEHQMRKGALCDLKGRILALLDVLNWSGYGFQLILPRDLLPSTKASLAKTAMFSRVQLKHESDYQLFGFHLQNKDDFVPFNLKLSNTPYQVVYQDKNSLPSPPSHDGVCGYCLGSNYYIFLVDVGHAQALHDEFLKRSQLRGSLAWHALQLQQERVEIYPESRGMFLPHRLGLQLSGYLSFDKGCYKGQEIIARTHYRAKLKHELRIFKIKTDEALHSGQKIFNDAGEVEVGELVDFCPIGDVGEYLIAASVVFECPERVLFEGGAANIRLLGQ